MIGFFRGYMKQFCIQDLDYYDDLKYFYEEYDNSRQGEIQSESNHNPKEIFEQAVYCFLTPATKSDSADYTYQELFKDDFFYHANLEELTFYLRKPPYIRFHNQKSARLLLWQQEGMKHVALMMKEQNASDKRNYIVKNVKGMNYKEATHFLRNIGVSDNLVILDRHILNFMKDMGILSHTEDMNKLSKNYLLWEQLFIDFINSFRWTNFVGKDSSIPRADFAIWASRVKKSDSTMTYERLLMLR